MGEDKVDTELVVEVLSNINICSVSELICSRLLSKVEYFSPLSTNKPERTRPQSGRFRDTLFKHLHIWHIYEDERESLSNRKSPITIWIDYLGKLNANDYNIKEEITRIQRRW
ncbi:hypothetical protein CEXT_539231 [Caerostris extrusa]|uniref:Maturase K n=1 Tax=Caerostris extrusa TaxID=172846 RepID=A0AAV4TS23_CAEEX|nr:hypothetical protein CEXT_539231 [Caerostris extrusa]